MITDRLFVIIIAFTIIAIIDFFARFDHVSKWFIMSFQVVWLSVLCLSCFQPNDLYLPATSTYTILSINVLCFTIGFSLIKINKNQNNDIIKNHAIYLSVKKTITNKYFIIYLLIIIVYMFSLLAKYMAKLAIVNSLGDLRRDFFYDNFYGDWFSYINILFLNPTQITLLGLSAYCILKYRKPILLIMLSFILIYSTLGGGRFDYGTIFISILFFATAFSKLNFRKSLAMIGLCIVMLCAFSLITNMRGTGKGTGLKELIENGEEATQEHIVGYSCGAVVAFDYAIEHDYSSKIGGYQYGGLTLSGFINSINIVTRRFGVDIGEPINKLMPYKQELWIRTGKNSYHNALYTAVLYPYLDFGILGVIFIPFLLGLFVRSAIKKLYKYKSIFLMILVNQCYIMAIYSVFDFRGITSPSTVFLMLFLYLNCNRHKIRVKSVPQISMRKISA